MKWQLAMIAALLPALVLGQNATHTPPGPGDRPEHHIKGRLDRMAEDLDLSAEQQADIEQLLLATASQREADKIAHHDALEQELAKILSPEQFAKHQVHVQSRHQHRRDDVHHGPRPNGGRR